MPPDVQSQLLLFLAGVGFPTFMNAIQRMTGRPGGSGTSLPPGPTDGRIPGPGLRLESQGRPGLTVAPGVSQMTPPPGPAEIGAVPLADILGNRRPQGMSPFDLLALADLQRRMRGGR